MEQKELPKLPSNWRWLDPCERPKIGDLMWNGTEWVIVCRDFQSVVHQSTSSFARFAPPEQEQTQWVPKSERLPTKEEVEACGDEFYVTTDSGITDKACWGYHAIRVNNRVVARMPMRKRPAPYQPPKSPADEAIEWLANDALLDNEQSRHFAALRDGYLELKEKCR